MLEQLIKQRKYEELVSAKVLSINVTTRRAKVLLPNKAESMATFPESMLEELSVGNIVLVGKTDGGGRVVIQKTNGEMAAVHSISVV